MKNKLFVFITTIACFSLLASCTEMPTEESKQEISELSNYFVIEPIESFDNESVFVPEGNTSTAVSAENSQEEVSTSEGFLIKDKKYTFESTHVVIVSAKNQTKENYVLTINGTYYDANGNVLLTESQSFDQFAADYQHYFLFQPEINFEKFTYTIDASETDAPMYVNDIELVFSGLQEAKWPADELVEQGDHTFYPVIQSMFGYRNKSKDQSLKLKAIGTVILLNEQDKIVAIYRMGSTLTPKSHVDYYTKQIYYTTNESLVWPEELQGEIRAIHATIQIYKAES